MDLDSFYIYNIISITRRYRSLMDTYPNRFYYIIAQLINDFFQRNTSSSADDAIHLPANRHSAN